MYFVHKKTLRKKLSVFGGILLLYGAGLWAFSGYGDFYQNYEPYYLKSYASAIGYAVSHPGSTMSLAFAGDETYVASTSKNIAGSVPVLLYHGVLNESEGSNLGLARFREHMFALKKAGYQTITLENLHEFLIGQKSLPPKSFLLTFDDGRKDSYYPTDPILRVLGFNAVMFAVAEHSLREEDSYYLTKSEILSMNNNSRWQVESHTLTHRDLSTLPSDELTNEIIDSKKVMEKLLGKAITAFAFPFGELGELRNEPSESIVGQAEDTYLMSFFQFLSKKRFNQNYSDPKSSPNYLVKRISVLPEWSDNDLLRILEAGSAKSLPFKAAFTGYDGWVNTLWGEMVVKSDSLSVNAREDSSGSAVILDGSRMWEDYRLSADVVWPKGSNIYLWVRFQDDDNYAACNFGRELVHVEETVKGKVRVAKGNAVSIPLSKRQGGFTASVEVRGRNVECFVDGISLVKTEFLDASLLRGGIGVKSWDQVFGVSSVTLRNIRVEPLVASREVSFTSMPFGLNTSLTWK